MNSSRDEIVDKAALKAIKATNLCLKHMEYHGQKFKDCEPQKRTLFKVKQDHNNSSNSNKGKV